MNHLSTLLNYSSRSTFQQIHQQGHVSLDGAIAAKMYI